MKTFLFASVASCISVLTLSNGAYAQDSSSIAMLQPPKEVIKMDKAINPSKDNTVNLNAISTKAVKNFRKSFKKVTEEKWSKNADGFSAGFTANGILNTVFYTKKGQWAGSLKGYNEDKLDRDVRAMVKREYYDYTITYVQEIQTPDSEGGPTYIIHLEDAKSIKQIRVNNGAMDVYQDFKKG